MTIFFPLQWVLSYFHMFLCLLVSIFSFQLEELPVVFLVSQVYSWWTSSAFFGLIKSLSLPHCWRTALLGIIILVSIFSSFNTDCSISLSPGLFLLRNPLTVLQGFPCMANHFFPASFKILSLSLTYENLIIMCFGDDLFMFNLSRVLCTSWIRTPSDLGGFLSLFPKIYFLSLFLSLLFLGL